MGRPYTLTYSRVAPSNLFEGDGGRFYVVLSGPRPDRFSSNQVSEVASDRTGKKVKLKSSPGSCGQDLEALHSRPTGLVLLCVVFHYFGNGLL